MPAEVTYHSAGTCCGVQKECLLNGSMVAVLTDVLAATIELSRVACQAKGGVPGRVSIANFNSANELKSATGMRCQGAWVHGSLWDTNEMNTILMHCGFGVLKVGSQMSSLGQLVVLFERVNVALLIYDLSESGYDLQVGGGWCTSDCAPIAKVWLQGLHMIAKTKGSLHDGSYLFRGQGSYRLTMDATSVGLAVGIVWFCRLPAINGTRHQNRHGLVVVQEGWIGRCPCRFQFVSQPGLGTI